MDYFTNQRFKFSALADFSNIHHVTKQHLIKVYSMLTVTLLFAIIGAFTDTIYHFGSILTLFLSIGLIFALGLTTNTPNNRIIRTGYLLSFGFLNGASI